MKTIPHNDLLFDKNASIFSFYFTCADILSQGQALKMPVINVNCNHLALMRMEWSNSEKAGSPGYHFSFLRLQVGSNRTLKKKKKVL